MYLAAISQQKQLTYFLRESVSAEDTPGFRDICSLGPRPGAWIDYPWGNAWHLCPELVSRVLEFASRYDADALEDLFWPFVRQDIRRATAHFRERDRTSRFHPMSRQEKETVIRTTHAFDKRRAHFLKFGAMDQGPLVNMSPALFRSLQGKSRDEIEQRFLSQEQRLKPQELKSYVYTICDLQRFFKGFMAKTMPHVLDQDKVDAFFMAELCRLNQELFGERRHLHDYLTRYAIMFFDHIYQDSVLLDEMAQDFMSRTRFFHRPPAAKPSVSLSRARQLFNLTDSEFTAMDKKSLTRRYRKLAREHHPDTGGSHDRFVEINEAYQTLLEKL